MLGLLLLAVMADTPSRTAEEIANLMDAADARRLSSMAGYTGVRHYALNNTRFNKHAELTVRVRFTSPGHKDFEIVSETGNRTISKLVLRRLVESEKEASQKQAESRIGPANYSFKLLGTAMESGRPCYVMEAAPKQANPLLFRGKIYVDAEEFSVLRIDGSPAKNPSFWLRSTNFTHLYQKFGPVWLAISNHSVTESRFFGTTTIQVTYTGYAVEERGIKKSE